MKPTDIVRITKELFPLFASATIEPQKSRSQNGTPVIVKMGENEYFVKIINNELIEDSIRGNEERALKAVDSRHVVKLIESSTKVLEKRSYTGLVFQNIPGDDLQTTMANNANGPFSEDEITQFLQHTATGVAAIWGKGWVHQDIKPGNIRYNSENGHFVLLDLGISHYAASFEKSTGKQNQRYMTPELIKAELGVDVRVTFNSDLFQLGTIAYEMATGIHPFIPQGKRKKVEKERIMKGDFTPVRELNSDISEHLESIIHKMLQPNPGFRFRAPEELLSMLAKAEYKPVHRFSPGIFFHICRGPQGYKNILEKDSTNFIDGIVIGASYKPADNFLSESSEKGYKLLVDPETYLLEGKYDKSWQGSLSKVPWYSYYPVNQNHFSTPQKTLDFVQKVVKYQESLEADYLVPPYFNLPNQESEWLTINGLFIHQTIKMAKMNQLEQPILAPICLSQNVLDVPESMRTIVDYYTQIPGIDGYMLRIDAPEHNISISTVQVVLEFIRALEQHHPVLLLDADVVSFGYLAFGLSGCATALAGSRRGNNLQEKESKKKPGGGGPEGPKEKIFIRSLMDFFLYDGDFNTLLEILGDDAICSCSVCSENGVTAENATVNWETSARNNHFLACLADWKRQVESLPMVDRENAYRTMLEDIRQLHHEYEENILFTQIVKDKNYLNWLAAFFPSS